MSQASTASTAGLRPEARMDTATRELLIGSLRELLVSLPDGEDLTPALAHLGWAEVLAEDPATAITLLFTEHGRMLVRSRALDDILLAELVAALPAGTGARRAVLYPHPADADRPGPLAGPLRGILLGPLGGVGEVLVPATAADGATVLLAVPAAEVTAALTPARGFDPGIGWHTVAGFLPAPTSNYLPAGPAWDRAVAAGRRALAAELLGVCDAALALAIEHTSARVQFGRPIGSFQAVRHRLAEGAVAVAAARSVLAAAWTAASAPDGGSWAAIVAKLRAGLAQADLMRNVVQVHGAMGVTWESDVRRYVTRAAALDALLGGHQALADAVGAALLAGTELDPIVEL